MQQTCHTQLAESSIERRSRSSPQVVWERGCTPELPLVIRDSQGNFTAHPLCVAELYAHQWKREWGGEDATGFVKEINSIRALRENMSQKHVSGLAFSIYGRKMFAKLVSLSRPKRLSVSTSTRLQTSHSSPTMPWNLWARLSDNVLSSWQYQPSHFCSCWSCWARKWREQNYRHLAHNMSPHHALGISTHQLMECQVCR